MCDIEKLKIDRLSSKTIGVLALSVSGITTVDTGLNIDSLSMDAMDERYAIIFGSIAVFSIFYIRSRSLSKRINDLKCKVYSL